MNSKVYLNACEALYPKAPFHPGRAYGEFKGAPWTSILSETGNSLYEAARGLLSAAYPSPEGNFLSHVIRPGDVVVVKPNLVRANHETRPLEWQQVITNGALLRAVIDYAILALMGKGEIIIAEAPQTDTCMKEAAAKAGVFDLLQWYAKTSPVPVTLLDLRKEEWESRDGVVIKRTALPGDPKGYEAVNLGSESAFAETDKNSSPLYGADYDLKETERHHSKGRHEYLLSSTVLHCDVLINLPKLKTHKKTGMTCAMKNLVGINGDKNWLPHYRLGDPINGGDQFAVHSGKTSSERALVTFGKNLIRHLPPFVVRLLSPVKSLFRLYYGDTHNTIRSGNWHGNDTCWRMVWDLNAALMKAGTFRHCITIVDGIIAGEGDGPLAPDAKPCGWLALSENPQAIDQVMAELMGFDPKKLKFLTRPLFEKSGPAQEIFLSEDAKRQIQATPPFKPHFGWLGYIEKSGN